VQRCVQGSSLIAFVVAISLLSVPVEEGDDFPADIWTKTMRLTCDEAFVN